MFIWTIGDVIGVAILGLAVVGYLALFVCFEIPRMFKQWRCKHDRSVQETMSCQAICNDCNKDLGFIGLWREKHGK